MFSFRLTRVQNRAKFRSLVMQQIVLVANNIYSGEPGYVEINAHYLELFQNQLLLLQSLNLNPKNPIHARTI
jgi:hypothetical protein